MNYKTIKGCKIIELNTFKDNRGFFKKTFNSNTLKKYGLNLKIKESYTSGSKKNVIRGMHFQIPPFSHKKAVVCISGKALDVVLDMRVNSPTYGHVNSFKLDAEDNKLLFLDEGLAHGFIALENKTILQYFLSSVYSEKHDKGVKWNSIKYNWKVTKPIVSKRDEGLPEFTNYNSPFNI